MVQARSPVLQEMIDRVVQFRDERDWKQFLDPKELAIGLSTEANELLAIFRFRKGEELVRYIEENKDVIADELADVFYFILLMSHDLGIDLDEAQRKKILSTSLKYPIEKSKGSPKKYTEL